MSAITLYAAAAASRLFTGVAHCMASDDPAVTLPSSKQAVSLLFDCFESGRATWDDITLETFRPVPRVRADNNSIAFEWDADSRPRVTERLHGTESTWRMDSPLLIKPSNLHYATLRPFVSGQWVPVPGEDGIELHLPESNPLGAWSLRNGKLYCRWNGALVRSSGVSVTLAGLIFTRSKLVIDIESCLQYVPIIRRRVQDREIILT